MKHFKLIIFILLCTYVNAFSQNLEIDGHVKLNNIPHDSITTNALVINSDGNVSQSDIFVEKKPLIGDFHEGGVVFYTFNGGKNGLIVSPIDVGIAIPWSPTLDSVPDARSRLHGDSNTVEIVDHFGSGEYAAYICDTLTIGNYIDWYLPSAGELSNLWRNIYAVNWSLENDNDHLTVGMLSTSKYWSSTDHNFTSAWGGEMFSFHFATSKTSFSQFRVRAIRKY